MRKYNFFIDKETFQSCPMQISICVRNIRGITIKTIKKNRPLSVVQTTQIYLPICLLFVGNSQNIY